MPAPRRTATLLAVLLAASATGAEPGATATPYRILAAAAIGGGGGWDYITVDEAARRIYVAHESRVVVLDADSFAARGEIPASRAHGIAIVPATGRGFIGNGGDGSVTCFDLATLAVVGHAVIGTKADALVADPASGQVFACDNAGTTVSALAASDGHVLATIEVGGAPEFAVADGKGRVYVNIEDRDEVVAIDAAKHAVIAHWPLGGSQPTGLAFDPKDRRLYSVCRASRSMAVLDADSGTLLASLPIGSAVDGVAWNPAGGDALASNGDGTVTVVHADGPAAFHVAQTLPTMAGARTIAFDTRTRHALTVSSGQLAGADHPSGFQLLVIGR